MGNGHIHATNVQGSDRFDRNLEVGWMHGKGEIHGVKPMMGKGSIMHQRRQRMADRITEDSVKHRRYMERCHVFLSTRDDATTWQMPGLIVTSSTMTSLG